MLCTLASLAFCSYEVRLPQLPRVLRYPRLSSTASKVWNHNMWCMCFDPLENRIRTLLFIKTHFREREGLRNTHLLHRVLRGIVGTTGTHALESRWLKRLARGCFSQRWLRFDGWHGKLTKGSVGDDARKKREAIYCFICPNCRFWWLQWHNCTSRLTGIWAVPTDSKSSVSRILVLCSNTAPSFTLTEVSGRYKCPLYVN